MIQAFDLSGRVDDTWAYNGTTWSNLGIADRPGVREAHGMTADTVHQRILVFGGNDNNLALYDDTWSFQYFGGVSESCSTGFDGDGDGLLGCADPDCWGRCLPQCAPFSTPSWPTDCDPTAPRCGDGVCNSALEGRRICPQDCGAPVARCGDFLCDSPETIASCPGDCTP